MKKFFAGLLAGILLALTVTVYAGSGISIDVLLDSVRVMINGEDLNKTTILYNSETYVPLRAVSEALGYSVTWDGGANTAYIHNPQEQPISGLPEITQEETTFLDTVYGTLYDVQYLYADLEYALFYDEESLGPDAALELAELAVEIYDELMLLMPPSNAQMGFKGAVNNYCRISKELLNNLISVIQNDFEDKDAINDAFAPLYESEALTNTEELIYNTLYDFLMERSGW